MKIHHRDLEMKRWTACGKRYGPGLLIETARFTKAVRAVAVKETTCLDCLRSLALDTRLAFSTQVTARTMLRAAGDTSPAFARRGRGGVVKKQRRAWADRTS